MAENGRVQLPMVHDAKPRMRSDCLDGGVNTSRPCVWTGCKYHIDTLKPEVASCVLDVADQGGLTLEEIGDLLGVTRERIRQIEAVALRRVRLRDASVYKGMLRGLLRD
jgi:hypothetical protein